MATVALVQVVRTPIPVHCLNCGSGDTSAVALIGIIIAAIALVVSFVALGVAIREHKLTIAEHAEFVKQLNARARFKLTARVVGGNSEGALEVERRLLGPPVSTALRIEIGLSNVGEKAATDTTLNVLVPASLSNFRWLDLGAGTSTGSYPTGTSETLPLPGGGETSAQWVTTEIRRLRLRTPLVQWVWFTIDPDMTQIPVRIKAQSDDLPDDVDEEVLDYVAQICIV